MRLKPNVSLYRRSVLGSGRCTVQRSMRHVLRHQKSWPSLASLTRLSYASIVELLPWTQLPLAADAPSHLTRVHCSNAAGVPGATHCHARSPAVLQASRHKVLSPSVPDCQGVFCLIFFLRGRPGTGDRKTRMRRRRWMTVASRGAKLVMLPSGHRCLVPSGHRLATFFRTTRAARLRNAR